MLSFEKRPAKSKLTMVLSSSGSSGLLGGFDSGCSLSDVFESLCEENGAATSARATVKKKGGLKANLL